MKSLADTGRMRALALVASAGEQCVCEIQRVLGMTASTASRNLRELESAGWLKSRREGRWIYYSPASQDAEREALRAAALSLFRKSAEAQRDLERHAALVAESDGNICSAVQLDETDVTIAPQILETQRQA